MLCTVRLFTKVTKQSSTISGRFLMVLCHSASSALCPTMQISILLAYHFITWKIAMFCHFLDLKLSIKLSLFYFSKTSFLYTHNGKIAYLFWQYDIENIALLICTLFYHTIFPDKTLCIALETWNLKLEMEIQSVNETQPYLPQENRN